LGKYTVKQLNWTNPDLSKPAVDDLNQWFTHVSNTVRTIHLSPKFHNPTITPSGRKVNRAERKRERREKTPLIVDT
jgi:hypothetical protein